MVKKVLPSDLMKCQLCYDAPCDMGCPYGQKPSEILRSIRFANFIGALNKINDLCLKCNKECEKKCVLDEPVKINDILTRCLIEKNNINPTFEKKDISVDFCGFKLENPFLLSSSVVASTYDMCKRAFDAGWAGAAFKTISMIDIHEASPRYSALKNLDGSFLAFKNIEQLSDHSVVENLEIIKRLKSEYPTKCLLISIMGRNEEEWSYLAKEVEKAGATAIELNFSCPNMVEGDTGSDVGQIPDLVYKYTKAVVDSVKIPVIAKLTPNVALMSPAALAAKKGGAQGIAAINTIKSLTELNLIRQINAKRATSKIAVGGLSGSAVKPIALRFIQEIASNPELKDMHISAMGGIYTYEDALSFLALGASSIQITTAVMEYGYRIIDDLTSGLEYFLASSGINSVSDLKGLLLKKVVDVEDMERDIVIYPKFIKENCIGCGRCYISCMDGGHQAIKFIDRRPTLDPKKCVGCHLCVLVCSNEAIVSSGIKVKKSR